MIIELATHNYQITWPRYPKPTHQEIVNRLKTISGAEFDKLRLCWWVPVAQGAKLLELFPKASYSVDAICAAVDAESERGRWFYESLRLMGIELRIVESGAIVATGEGVSALIQTLIDERTAALLPLVQQAGSRVAKPSAQPAPVQGPLTVEDAKLEPLLKGIQNAAQRREVDKTKRTLWRRKAKVQQGSLFE
jgi:hypothetical protein